MVTPPASGNEQLGNSFILAFTAADLGPEQFDCRRSPAVDKAVEFVRNYLRAGTKHCREVYEAATTLPVSRSVVFKAARCLGIRMNGSGLWTLPKVVAGDEAVEASLAGRKCG